jgi:amidophosphoribosyltransferase
MADELQHECGVAAVYFFDPGRPSAVCPGGPATAHKLLPRMLLDLQNRGQLSAGLSTYNPTREQLLDTYKDVGTVEQAFRTNQAKKFEAILDELAGPAGIGHVRYATCGPATKQYAQPFERRHGCKWKWFAFGFNGNLANYPQLKEQLLALGDHHLTRDNDTEAILHHLTHGLRGDTRPDLVGVFRELCRRFDGAYNLTFLNALGELVVLRDPLGLRPLVYATDGGLFAAASESVALQNMGFRDIRDLPPGHLLLVRPGGVSLHRYADHIPEPKHCFFEWVYFANVASVLDGKSVYLSRSALGRELAQQERAAGVLPDLGRGDTVVVPVPDTGKSAADAMAFELGLPSVEGLIRNRYVGRTFIEAGNRADKVRTKFTPLRPVLEGKRVILVEDSLVRSTTLANLLSYVREQGGAREVHVRVACPPIVAPCFYGIDMSTVGELYAPKFMAGPVPTLAEQQEMGRRLGADSLLYLPAEALARCVGLPPGHLCRACVTGDYPTPTGQERYDLQLDRVRRAVAPAEANGCHPGAVKV